MHLFAYKNSHILTTQMLTFIHTIGKTTQTQSEWFSLRL